jgi:hypothetical protein
MFLAFCCCRQTEIDTAYSIPDSTDIDQIISVIIAQDSLGRSENDSSKRSTPVLKHLRKLYVAFPLQQGELPLREYMDSVNAKELLSYRICSGNNLTQRDSNFFLFQNRILKRFVIADTLQQKILTVNETSAPHYDISIPIFSANKSKAYVIVSLNKTGLDNQSYSLSLKKANGQWKIEDRSY